MPGSRRLTVALAVAGGLLSAALFHLRRSPGLALTSLFIGIALWLLVTEEENPTRIDFVGAPVPIEAANLAPQLAVANALPSVQVRIAAPTERWDDLSAANFRAFVDLNNLEAREQQVPVRVEVVGTSQVRVLETIPSMVTVNLEELLTRTVSINPRVVGALPRGYELAGIVPDRATAEVSGPKSLVSLVGQAAASVNVTGLTVPIEQTVALTPVAEGGGEIRGVTVRPATTRLSVSIRQEVLTRTLPLEVDIAGQPAPGFRITGIRVSPSTVRVEGPIDVLQGLDTLRLPRVDVSGQQADMRVNVRVTPPEGMATATQQAVVEVGITPVPGSISFTLVPDVLNLRPGMTARTSPGSVLVIVEGPLPRLNALTPGSVRASIDGANLNPGTTEARVLVTAPEGVTVREVQPAVVSVTVTRS